MGKLNVFISCVSEKDTKRCKAKDLYISPLFQKAFAYAQSLNPTNIYILSAKYYVVDLDEVISPYDVTLKDMDADEKRDWVDNVLKVMDKKGISRDDKTVFLAGHAYLDYLVEHFTNYTIPYQDAGLEGIGYIMEWLDKQIGSDKAKAIEKMCSEKFEMINKDKTMSLINRLKLAKLIMKFAEIETDKGTLTYEGDLIEGVEVFIEKEGEGLVPAEDGEYVTEDKVIKVEGGVVTSITDITKDEGQEGEGEGEEVIEENMEGEEKPTETNDEVEGLKNQIQELETQIAEKDALITELNAKIAELEDELTKKTEQLKMSVAKPAHKEIKDIIISNKENKALRFFENK